jgi:hypothetical protein
MKADDAPQGGGINARVSVAVGEPIGGITFTSERRFVAGHSTDARVGSSTAKPCSLRCGSPARRCAPSLYPGVVILRGG